MLRSWASFSPIRCCFLCFSVVLLRCSSIRPVSLSCDLFPYFRGSCILLLALVSLFIALHLVSLVSSSLLLVWGTGFCSPSASFGSPVPFATWSPFGTSQGLVFPISLGFLVSIPCWTPLGHISIQYFYDSFASAVPLETWSPFGMSQGFAGSSVWVPLP